MSKFRVNRLIKFQHLDSKKYLLINCRNIIKFLSFRNGFVNRNQQSYHFTSTTKVPSEDEGKGICDQNPKIDHNFVTSFMDKPLMINLGKGRENFFCKSKRV